MAGKDDKNESLNASYLALHQGLEFSRNEEPHAAKRADIERRRSLLKYEIAKRSVNAQAAGCLLKDDLDKYAKIIDSQNGINNYWNQFHSLNVETRNNPLEWKLNLSDPSLALQHAQALPCCKNDPTKACKNESFSDRDIEKVMGWWKSGEVSPRARKVSGQAQELLVVNQDTRRTPRSRDPENCLGSRKVENETRPRFNLVQGSRSPDRANDHLGKRGKVSFPAVERNQQKTPIENDETKAKDRFAGFKTAKAVLSIQQSSKNNKQAANRQQFTSNQPIKKTLGGKGVSSPFVNPFKEKDPRESEEAVAEPTDERLKSIEPKMIELIRNEIMDCGSPIAWDDIAGLERAKKIIQEIVVYPMLRPDIFTGLRRPPKGILLFGPPGTGKTLIGKCIASQSKSTFFSISASSLTSKWVGEGEKMVRALFAVAQVEQPSVVFIDEIDSLLCQRSETEHESSRRMKTEFLVQLDGCHATGDEDRILVIGATNRPYELDEAARRRFVKRLYIPLPELEARKQIVRNLLKTERHGLAEQDIHRVADLADGYSGADMTNLCKEASMGPIRSIPFDQLQDMNKDDVRPVTAHDFQEALDTVRPSVSPKDLSVYLEWDRTFGTGSAQAR